MSDLIDRQQAIDAVRVMQTYKLSEGDDMLLVDKAEVMTELMMLPSAEPVRMKGRWNKIHWKAYRCSECERVSEYQSNFCPNCGADMRGEEDD